MSLSKADLKVLRVEVDAALKAVGEKLGYTLKQGNTRFDPTDSTFSTKVEGTKLNKAAIDSGEDPAKLAYDTAVKAFNRGKYGDNATIAEGSYNRTFVADGTTFRCVSINPRAKSYPIVGQNASGTRYKFPANVTRQNA